MKKYSRYLFLREKRIEGTNDLLYSVDNSFGNLLEEMFSLCCLFSNNNDGDGNNDESM